MGGTLVERLRARTFSVWSSAVQAVEDFDDDLANEAADEIERLHAELAEFRNANEKPEWWLSQTWSACLRKDGRWEPAAQISGNGISFQSMARKMGSFEMARFWAEELGRIGKGEPLFHIDAMFRFDAGCQSAPLQEVPRPTPPQEAR